MHLYIATYILPLSLFLSISLSPHLCAASFLAFSTVGPMDRSPPSVPVENESRCSSGDQSITAPVVEFGGAVIALANRVVDAVFGRTPTNIQHEEAVVSAAPMASPIMLTGSNDADANYDVQSKAFEDCLNSFEFDDVCKCQYYMDMLADCRRNLST